MAIKRSELREKIMTILYQIEMYKKSNYDYDINKVIKENMEVDNDFVNSIVIGVLNNINELDDLANKYLNNWSMNRLNKVDQAILALGIYELKYTDTPSIVAINEAVELSKNYSDEAVTKMINGVLDKVYHEEEK